MRGLLLIFAALCRLFLLPENAPVMPLNCGCSALLAMSEKWDNSSMETWIYYNPNPCKRSVGDCAVRAVAKALDISWKRAYALLTEEGYNVCDMPSSDAVWGNVLRRHGFVKRMIQQPMYTARDFCIDHPEGVYVLAFGGHVATVIDGFVFDSWNSSNEIVQYFFEMED